MSINKSLSEFLYYITIITTSITLLITVYFVFMTILALFDSLPRHMDISFEAPIRLKNVNDHYEAKALVDGFKEVRIEIEDARLKAQPTQDRLSQTLGYLIAAIYTSFFLGILYQLHKVFESFKNNIPFSTQNVLNISRIGWLTIGLVFFELVIHITASIVFQGKFSVTNAEFIDSYFFEKINFIALFLGLIILALSEVFKRGVTLQENEDLTV